jgi:hypothetical protein
MESLPLIAVLVLLEVLHGQDPERRHPAELPVEQATTGELVRNLKTARALSLTMPHCCSNPAMTSVTPVCTLADLIPYAPTRTALIAAWRRTCAPAAVASEGDTTPRILGA